MAAVPEEGVVETLVAAIKDHREFRQLSCYSIECVAKALDRQNAHWRDFTERAIDCDAAPIILDILRTYPGHDDVLGRCTTCLARVASDPSAAAYMAKQDGIGAALYSIEKGGDALSEESISQALLFVDVMVSHAQNLSDTDSQSVISKLVLILETLSRAYAICRAALQILERISKSSSEIELLATQVVIEALLGQLSLFIEEYASTSLREGADSFHHHDASLCITKVLLHLSNECSRGVMPILRALGTEAMYLRLLDIVCGLTNKEGDSLCRLGGRLLGKLVARSAANIVADATGENLDRNLGLLLMLSQSNQNDILRTLSQENISQILAHLSADISEKSFTAASRIVQLVCSSASGANIVMCCDGVMILADSLSSPNATPESMVAALESIRGIISYDTRSDAYYIIDNIIESFMTILESHARYSFVVLSILKSLSMIAGLFHDEGNAQSQRGVGIKAHDVVNAMWQHQSNAQIQRHGTILLIHLWSLRACDVSVTSNDSLLPAMCELVVCNIRRGSEIPEELLMPSLDLLSRLITNESGKAEVLQVGGLGAISKAMVNNLYHDGVVPLSSDLVGSLANEHIVRDLVNTLTAYIEGSAKSGMAMMPLCLDTVAALAMNAGGLEIINACGGFGVMVNAFSLVSSSVSDEDILCSVMKSLTLVLTRSQVAREFLDTTKILSSSALVLRHHSSEVSTKMCCLRLVSASIRSSKQGCIVESGVIESLVTAFKFHAKDAAVALEAIELLTTLAKSGLSGELSKKGLARQMITSAQHFDGCKETSLLAKALLLLEELCKESAGIAALKRSGSISVVLGIISSQPKDSFAAYSAIAKMVSSSDLFGAITNIKTEIGKSSHDICIEKVEKLVRKVAMVYRCFEDVQRENAEGAILDAIAMILEHESMGKRTRATIYLTAACLETVCDLGSITEYASIITRLAKEFFITFKEAASIKLFPGMLGLIRNEAAMSSLDGSEVVYALLGIIQKSHLDPELASEAVLALLLLFQQSSFPRPADTDLDAIICVSEYILFATEQKLSAGMANALDLLHELGRHAPHLLLDEHVLDSLAEAVLFLDAAGDVADGASIFVSATKVLCRVASSEQGMREVASRNIPSLFVSTCQAFCAIGQMPECISLVADLLGILTKNLSLKDDLCGGPLRRVLVEASRDCHLDRGHYAALAKACQALQRESTKSGAMDNELDNCLHVLIGNTSDFDFIQVEIDLSKCCELLLELTQIDEADAKRLVVYVQSILSALRIHDGCINRGKMRSLSFTLVARLMEAKPEIEMNEAFFVDECCSVDSPVSAVTVYSFLCLLVRSERGILAVAARPKVLNISLNVAAFVAKTHPNIQSLADILADQVIARASSLRRSEAGVEAIARILSAVNDLIIARITRGICGKVRGIWLILDVMSLLVDAEHSYPPHVAERVAEVVLSRLGEYFSGSVLPRKYFNTIVGLCEQIHKAVLLFSLVEKTEENVNVLVAAGFLRAMKKCLSEGETNTTRVATSVLSECLVASSSFLDHLKDVGLLHALLALLNDQAGASSQSFVQDALHIIGSLISHYGASAFALNPHHVQCIEKLSTMYMSEDYIRGITADILSEVGDSLSRSADIIDQLGALSSFLGENQVHQKTREGAVVSLKDQLNALSSTIDRLREDCIDVDARLAQPLIDILRRYGGDKDVVLLALSVLKKMGDRHWLATLLESNGGMPLLIEVIRKHPTDGNIVHLGLEVAFALSHKSPLELHPSELAELIHIFNCFASNHGILVLMLKLMGRLTLCDANISNLIDCNAAYIIAEVMQGYLSHKMTLRLAILVLSNFGAMQNKQEGERVAVAVSEQGGTTFVMQCMELHRLEPFLAITALVALFNLSSDGSTLNSAATHEVLEHSLRAMQWLDYDSCILSNANKIVALFSSTETELEVFHEYDLLNIMLNTLQQHEQDVVLIELISLNLANRLASRKVQLDFSQNQRRNVNVLLTSLERHKGRAETVKRILVACALLARSGIGATGLTDGLHRIIMVSKAYIDDQATSSCVIEVLGHLSIQGHLAAAAIMQNGGVELLLRLLDSYSQVEPMVIGAFRVMDNLLGVSTESNGILVEAGAEKIIQNVMRLHNEKDVVKALGAKLLDQFEQFKSQSDHRGWCATDEVADFEDYSQSVDRSNTLHAHQWERNSTAVIATRRKMNTQAD